MDIQILRALWEVGPRNLSKIAREVGISRRTLDSRVRRMRSNPQIFLRIQASIYHTKIGLRKAIVFLTAKAGREQVLFDCLKANSFWLYVCRSYGMVEGCTAAYAIPVNHCAEFEEFIQELERLEVAEDAKIRWSTCFQGGRITSEWFDGQRNEWTFRWKDWIKEVQSQSTELPYTLVEPKSFPICADDLDVQILMKMEADGTRSLKQIAEKLGVSRQLAQFHYKKHLLERQLIEGYEVFAKRYGDNPTIMAYFVVAFPSQETFARFARSLIEKPFVLTLGKVLGENALMFEVTFTIDEFRNFVDALSELARMRLATSYWYALQDLRMGSRQTFSGEFFKDGSWSYDHRSHMETLRQKARMST